MSGAGSVPLGSLRLPDDYIPPTQPPSARRPDTRKSQLLRSYTALLRSTPLILFFQHNNLTAVEWAAVRREIRAGLAQVSAATTTTTERSSGDSDSSGLGEQGGEVIDISSTIQIQVLRTRIFDVALQITEFFDPAAQADRSNAYMHDLSEAAYDAIKNAADSTANVAAASTAYAQIKPLMTGPVAAVTFPAVSPEYLAAVLRVLAPSPPAFPAPPRRKSPGYYDATAQSGLHKLLLIGGRVEGRVFDQDGVRWVGGIEGGLGGMHARLVAMLQSAGLGLTTTLEGGSKGLWLTLESRRIQLEEGESGGADKKET